MRQPATSNKTMSPGCNNCSMFLPVRSLKQCYRCESVRYCSAQCQKKHWNTHKVLCNSINQLQVEKNDRVKDQCEFSTKDANRQARLVSLLGKRCLVQCLLNKVPTNALWDTGAEVSLVSLNWLKENITDFTLCEVENLVGVKLDVQGLAR